MGVLGLQAVVIREDMAQGASHRRSNPCAILAGVSDKEVELFFRRSPTVWTFFLRQPCLSELADDAAPLIAVFLEPNLGMLLKGNDGFTDFEGFEEARFCQEGKKLCRSPVVLREMFFQTTRGRQGGSLRSPISGPRQSQCQCFQEGGH